MSTSTKRGTRFSVAADAAAAATHLDAALLDALHYLLHLPEELLLGAGRRHGPETESHPEGSHAARGALSGERRGAGGEG